MMQIKVRKIIRRVKKYLLTSTNMNCSSIALVVVGILCSSIAQASALAIDQKAAPFQALGSAQERATITGQAQKVKPETSNNDEAALRLTRTDTRRPIWALAHMVNSIKELDYRLARGANAVEADVTFGRDGEPLYTYHGPPCDCWRHCYQREELKEYLGYVRELTVDATPGATGQNLSLLFLDLKLDALDQRAKARAGSELAKLVLDHLYAADGNDRQAAATATAQTIQLPVSLNLILSVNHVQDADLIQNFIHHLESHNSSQLLRRIGFDVGMNDDLQQIDNMWRRFGPNLNLWQGDGYTNCLSPFHNLQRLSKALSKRDQPHGFPAKVYHWTIDLHDRIRESLRLGVDAIMTNHPERVSNVLQEPEMAHNYRLAGRLDDPFKKLTRDSVSHSSGETARYQRSAGPSSGGFLASLFDVFVSWLSYVREIPIFSLPTTIVSPSRATSRQRLRLAGASNQTASLVTLVKLQNQSPEYSVDPSPVGRADSAQQPASAAVANLDSQQTSGDYEGPKWYTSVASSMLVTLMRLLLPT